VRWFSPRYVFTAACWLIVCKVPMPHRWRLVLLPHAGSYAYYDDPWVRWCREANYQALDLDRPEPFPGDPRP